MATITGLAARLTLTDGNIVTITPGDTWIDGDVTGRFVETPLGAELWIRNGGGPDNFYNNKPWQPEPFYFDRLDIVCPGFRPQLAEAMLARPQGSTWVIASPSGFKHHHKRAKTLQPTPTLIEQPQPVYVPSLQHHMIDGGDTLYVRLVPDGDHLEFGDPPRPLHATNARFVADIDQSRANDPAIRRILDLYRVTPSSFSTQTKARDWGWWMVPENFVYQWTSQNIESVRGWYPAGDLRSPSDGPSNCHYDHDANALMRFLLTGDQTSLFLGLTMVRTKIAYGLIDTDLPRSACNLKGWWRGEKGGFRRGEGVGASTNKEWDAGLCLAWSLYPEDELFQHAMNVRRDCLLQRDNAGTWNHAGGGRAIGHYLFNLLDHYSATTDDAFATRAASFIDHVFQLTGDLSYFPNTLRPGFNACWEEALAHASIAHWIELGVGTAHSEKLDSMIQWLIQNGSEEVAPGRRRVAFEVRLQTGQRTWAGWTPGALWARLPQSAERDAVIAHTLSFIPQTPSVTWGSMGPGWEKQIGQIAYMVRR